MGSANVEISVQLIRAPSAVSAGEKRNRRACKAVAFAPINGNVISVMQNLRPIRANIKPLRYMSVPPFRGQVSAWPAADEGRHTLTPKQEVDASGGTTCATARYCAGVRLGRPACRCASTPPKGGDWSAALWRVEKCDSRASLRQLGFINCRTPNDGL